MNRRLIAFTVAGLLLIGVVVAVVAAISGDDGDGQVAGPAETTTTTLPLSDAARELVDRLAAARKRDLHLVYTGSLPNVPDGTVTIEVWWKGGRTRQSVVAQSAQERQESAAFVLPGGNVFCQRTQDIEWICQRAVSAATASGQPAGIIDSLAAGLNGKDVKATPAKVGEADADCYTIDPATGDVLCLRKDDIPVRFSLGGSELVFSKVETSVDDSVFEPPAKVLDQPPPSTTSTTRG